MRQRRRFTIDEIEQFANVFTKTFYGQKIYFCSLRCVRFRDDLFERLVTFLGLHGIHAK